MTSANPNEESHAVEYNDEYKTYLSSEFSKHWLEDVEQVSLSYYALTTTYDISNNISVWY